MPPYYTQLRHEGKAPSGSLGCFLARASLRLFTHDEHKYKWQIARGKGVCFDYEATSMSGVTRGGCINRQCSLPMHRSLVFILCNVDISSGSQFSLASYGCSGRRVSALAQCAG